MNRALFKIFIGLAVAFGLTFASAPVATAAPSADRLAAAAAPDCTVQQSAHAKATNAHTAAAADAKAANHKVKKFKKKIKKAKKADAPRKKIKKLKKKLKKAKKARTAKVAYARTVAVTTTYTSSALSRCQTGAPATGNNSPIQALCDAGVPQPLCDALAGLIPGGSTANPIGLLCAQFPQAQPLCDLIGAGLPTDPADLLDLIEGLLVTLGLGDLLDTIGLGDLLGTLGLDALLDLLGLGGLLGGL